MLTELPGCEFFTWFNLFVDYLIQDVLSATEMESEEVTDEDEDEKEGPTTLSAILEPDFVIQEFWGPQCKTIIIIFLKN